jgi:hypothetical protein
VQLPFALIPLLHFSGSKEIMGNFHANKKLLIFSWAASFFVIAVNIFIVTDYVTRDGPLSPGANVALVLLSVLYVLFCLFLMKEDATKFRNWLGGCFSSIWRRQQQGGLQPFSANGTFQTLVASESSKNLTSVSDAGNRLEDDDFDEAHSDLLDDEGKDGQDR